MDIKKGFTKADNSILFNSELSNNAKLVYIQIKFYSNIDGFKLSKSLILKDSQLSINTFDKVIKELRQAGLVFQYTEKQGKKNIYWYSTNDLKTGIDSNRNKPLENPIDLTKVTGEAEKVNAIKQSRQTKIDNHENVRLVRNVKDVNIDKSKFDKDILTFADVDLVRSTVKEFKKKAKYNKNNKFLCAKTFRNILIQEYYNSQKDFNPIMLKKINAVRKLDGEIAIKQYSEIADEIELREALKELEAGIYPVVA